MKPLYLTMSGFGPYGGEETIDFTDDPENGIFRGSGIFLVTGDTGAGKTTIFDAISFALYGVGSAGKERRESPSFRSDYALPEQKTFVDYTFIQKGKTYRIVRNPDYMRKSKRGDRMTKESANAFLECQDTGEQYDRLTEVNEKILEIIGLDRAQFAQTVMIAQGDFLRILNAKSKERQEIFQKIFNTALYERLQREIQRREGRCKRQYEDLQLELKTEIGRIQLGTQGEHTEMEQRIADLLEGENCPVEQLLPLLREYTEGKQEEKKELEKERKTLDKELETLVRAEEQGKKNNERLQALGQAEKQKEKLEEQAEEQKALSERLALAEKAERLTPLAQACTENAQLLDKERKEKAERVQEKEREEESRQLWEEKYASALEKREEREQWLVQIQKWESALERIRDFRKTEKAYRQKQETYRSCQERERETNERHRRLREVYLAGSAGLLAETLQEGEACPVCGSTLHPKPAVLSPDFPRKEEVDQAEREYQQAKEASERAVEQVTREKAKGEELEKQLKEIGIGKERSEEELEKTIKERQRACKEYDRQWEEITAKQKECGEKIAALEASLQEKGERIKNLERKKKQLASEYAKGLSQAGFASEEEYREACLPELERRALRSSQEKYKQAVSESQGAVKTLREETAGLVPVDLEENRQKQKEIQDCKAKREKEWKELQRICEVNEACQKALEKKEQGQKELREQWTMIQDLDETFNGRKKGQAKMSLEVYVQRYYFRQVIEAANQRLRVMTGETFVLRCKEEAKNNRAQSGLDLDVFDSNTAKWRDVSTLSGGESFMAALAMALGLSDVVQERSGGIRLESMFIDEGFGTLDEQALKQALTLLDKLADGKRMIGIISHVEELKNRIDNKIVIEKTMLGSRIVK